MVLRLGSARNERAVWTRTVTISRVALLVVGIGLAAALALLVALLWTMPGAEGRGILSLAMGVLVLATILVGVMTVFRVRVDDRGFEVRSAVGWPRKRIPREQIRSAAVVHVHPMGDYAGWGWRYGIGAGWGVIMRAGEAIRIMQENGKTFTVTVDDAETGASLLNAFSLGEDDRTVDGGRGEAD